MTDKSQQTILIVEDNQDSRDLVVKVLRVRGYRIVEAVDGEEALQKAAAEHPALILLDISLPKIDGYEVLRRLKALDEYRDIPIIALTAHAMKGDREMALTAGFQGYIPKPITIRELPAQVEAFLTMTII